MKDHEITEQILAASFDVINELGAGFLESVYGKALILVLQDKGLQVVEQAPIPVHFRGQKIGVFFADILVENRVIIELKAVKALASEHLAQVINYLKASGLETALLVNFGQRKIEYRRLNNRTEIFR
jgi:GxxExxY protein